MRTGSRASESGVDAGMSLDMLGAGYLMFIADAGVKQLTVGTGAEAVNVTIDEVTSSALTHKVQPPLDRR